MFEYDCIRLKNSERSEKQSNEALWRLEFPKCCLVKYLEWIRKNHLGHCMFNSSFLREFFYSCQRTLNNGDCRSIVGDDDAVPDGQYRMKTS